MGREIRRVPPNWDHPKEERYDYSTGAIDVGYSPLFDRDAEESWKDWLEEFEEWKANPKIPTEDKETPYRQ